MFIITTEKVQFVDLVLKACVGPDWKSFFTLCIVQSRGNLFHETEQPFYCFDPASPTLKGEKITSESQLREASIT
jgi:hypothetical protein